MALSSRVMRFKNRIQAGELLAEKLSAYQHQPVVVYALPRGGVVLGRIIADRLGTPFDLLIPRKIGHPSNPEYAIASVTETGEVITNEAEVASIDAQWFKREVEAERKEAKRRRERYLAGRPSADVANKTAIIVDDGIATGLTMKAVISDLKQRKPLSIIVAVPVAPRDTVHELEQLVDRVVILEKPLLFMGAIGSYYDSFEQLSDEEVMKLL